MQEATRSSVEVTFVGRVYTGPPRAHGIELALVKHAGAKRGFVLLTRRWAVERPFARAARFRRLARDYECLTDT